MKKSKNMPEAQTFNYAATYKATAVYTTALSNAGLSKATGINETNNYFNIVVAAGA